MTNRKFWLLPFAALLFQPSCKTLKEGWDNLNLFPVSQDIQLGLQVSNEIALNQKEYPLVPEAGNEELYNYVRGITKKILATKQVEYANDFPWKVHLINDIKTQNAFATPGGYIYIYTGLIQFLDSEDQLAGVLGHEIAHAAKRHSTKQLTKTLGIQVLADAALGNRDMAKQVATTLLALSFSRAHETEADSMSVIYLCTTDYNAAGSAGFFKKIEGQATPPSWLSTHPSPKNRIDNIEGKQRSMACKGKQTYASQFNKIKALLTKIPPSPGAADSQNPSNTEKDKMGKTAPTNTGTEGQNKKIEKPK